MGEVFQAIEHLPVLGPGERDVLDMVSTHKELSHVLCVHYLAFITIDGHYYLFSS